MRINEAILMTSAAVFATTISAGPLDKSKVSEHAKWVLHLDFDSFRSCKVGRHLTDQVLQPKLEAAKDEKKLNLAINFNNISSVTAYGPGYEKNGEGVLLIETSANVKNDLDALVGLAALAGSDKEVRVTQQDPYLLYNLDDELYLAPLPGKFVLIAKSKDQIANAREVVLGKAASLSASRTFSGFPAAPEGFFFLGMAEGMGDSSHIPPQAKILKETSGGRFVLGEKEGSLFLNVVFKGKDPQSCTNVSQVLQGLVALVRITQQDEEVTALANSAKIGNDAEHVSLTLQVPVGKAISKIDEKAAEEQ